MKKGWLILFLVGILAIVVFLLSKPSSPPNPTIDLLKKRLGLIDKKFEHIPIREGESSYTENKSIIYLCLVDPKTGHAYSMNTLIYVALHEVGHVISKKYGHGEEWKNNFQKLLNRAISKGLYDPSYPVPHDYCGTEST